MSGALGNTWRYNFYMGMQSTMRLENDDFGFLIHASESVADAGFLEGGFCYNNARKARTKFLGHTHISSKPRPFSNVFERSFLLYLSIHLFSIEIFAKAC